MRTWVGHLAGRPTSWFLAWAGSQESALDSIREDVGEPDPESLRPVKGHGYFLFQAEAVTSPSGLVELRPALGEYLMIYDESTEDWILRRIAAQDAVVGPPAGIDGRPEAQE